MDRRREVTIRSVHDGASLTFSQFRSVHDETNEETFIATARVGPWFAEVSASTYMAMNLGEFFNDLAANWSGWEGEKSWGSLEGEVTITATADRTGHIKLRFSLTQPYTGFEWQVSGALELEAGSLEYLAVSAANAWNKPAT
ncbi:DUF6228 family protein [Paracidovorax sp. MALMAid1276]|uniref:DUF6228 family protein n=1 Tax=Paracidovorax sp. MALMAid1276 TaxID=3411631 RepID=UPI003B9AC423